MHDACHEHAAETQFKTKSGILKKNIMYRFVIAGF